jgi:cell division protein ZapA
MSQMKTVTGTIYGKEYTLACDIGQEKQLQGLISQLNQRSARLETAIGKLPENLMLLYTALMVADELHESQKEIAALTEELTQARRLLESGAGNGAVDEAVSANLFELATRLDSIASKLAA